MHSPEEIPSIVSMPRLVRMSAVDIAGLIEGKPPDAAFFMNQYQIFSTMGNRDFALAMQQKALERSTLYRINAERTPAIRLLALMTPGDSSENTPIEYLIENSDIELDLMYALPGKPYVIPDHDLAIVAAGTRSSLEEMEKICTNWPQPLLNHAQFIRRCARETLWKLLQDIPGLIIAPTTIETRQSLITPQDYPMTIRPLDSQAGQGLARIADAEKLKEYLEKSEAKSFHVSRFIDYKSADGLYRKIRIALIDGKPYVCHLAISEDWIVHYGSSNMGGSAKKRSEEENFMQRFDSDFLPRHRATLSQIAERIRLDYVVMDCAETGDGRLLIFEADNRGWVHATDPIDLFPYKQEPMKKVFSAFRSMLVKAMRQSCPAHR